MGAMPVTVPEPSCRWRDRCLTMGGAGACNVDCPGYEWDGETAPVTTTDPVRAALQAVQPYRPPRPRRGGVLPRRGPTRAQRAAARKRNRKGKHQRRRRKQ